MIVQAQTGICIRRRPFSPKALLLVLFPMSIAGCDGLTDVDNPNNVLQEDLQKPQASAALVNGSLNRLSAAYSWVIRNLTPVSDEVVWVGSWDATRDLDYGNPGDPENADVNSAFNNMSTARWLVDETIRQLEEFDQAKTLANRSLLARAYLYGGITYATIGDAFDDFTFSDRAKAAPPVGEANMHRVYDQAIGYLDKALTLAEATNAVEERRAALAMRARAKYAKALWQKLNPAGNLPADPLVNDPGAVADARAFLALGAPADYRFRFTYSGATEASTFANEVNVRGEQLIGPAYAITSGKKVTGIRLQDPINNIPDPALSAIVNEFLGQRQFAPLTVVSAREMHLILAEAALAQGRVDEAVQSINRVRALTPGLTPYDPARHSVSPLEMLKHTRRVNLFFQGRRLADQYRFRIRSAEWLESSQAVRKPGTFMTIGQTERLSNCHITGTPCS